MSRKSSDCKVELVSELHGAYVLYLATLVLSKGHDHGTRLILSLCKVFEQLLSILKIALIATLSLQLPDLVV